MHPAGADAYPVHHRLEAKFKGAGLYSGPSKLVGKDLVEKAIEFMGEAEHDPSLIWPEMYPSDIGQWRDEDVEIQMARVQVRLEALADGLFEFVGFVLGEDKT